MTEPSEDSATFNIETNQKSIEPKFFIIGCVLLTMAIGLAVWAFGLKNLTVFQERILQWALPLASGFGAGAFAGSLSVKTKSKGLIPGLVVSATGGFGVWLITIYFLIPVQNQNSTQGKRADEIQVMRLYNEVVKISGNWERASTKYPELLNDVRTKGSKAAMRLASVPTENLDAKHQLIKFAAASNGFLCSALSEDLLKKNSNFIKNHAENSTNMALKCIDRLLWLKNQSQQISDPNHDEWNSVFHWAENNDYPNYCLYLLSTGLLFFVKYSDGKIEDVVQVMDRIEANYLRKYKPISEPLFKWACEKYKPKLGDKICQE